MVQKRDYYEVLGVIREANDDDIRKAYRQCALKHHPDRNPGDHEAEHKFKEATEAYSVLNDKEKRSAYDRFGHAGLEGRGGVDFSGAGVGDILSHFQDLFSDFFGGGFGGGGRQSRAKARGADVRADVTLTLEDCMKGTKREVAVHGVAPCEECGGNGAKPGTKPAACPQCGGAGQVGTQRGFVMFSTTCPKCRGSGQVVANPCEKCSGSGAIEKQRKVVVTMPAGIDGGQRLRVPGQGMPGPKGAPPGDLYVDVEVETHPRFERHGYDLVTKERVSFPEATLGTEVSVTLPDGTEVATKVPAGTHPGTVLTIQAKGLPQIDRSARGSLHILVEVEVPKRLSKRAKKLLEDLAEELGEGAESRAEAR
jgi:molecular chaperone DnaJ